MNIIIEQDINIICDECGKASIADYDINKDVIKIEPCETCMESNYKEGHNEGHDCQ